MSYQGFLIREIYQDNRDFYRGQLDLNRESVMLREIARQNLALQEKFEPGIEHTRLVSHVINIFEVKDVNWRKKGDLVIPKGNLEQLLSLDLGHQIKIICDEDQEFKEEELGNLTIALPDGTYLVGTQVKRSKYFGSQDKKILPNDFLDVRFNPKDYKEKNHFRYSFSIKRNILAQTPVIFQIKSYVTIDGDEVSSKSEVVWPMFDKNLKECKGFHYSSKLIN